MRVAFVDIQGFAVDGWFVPKELTIEIGFKRSHYIFLPPKPFNALSNDDKKTASYVEKKLLGIRYSDGAVELSKINEILETKLLYAADYIYVRGEQKAEFLSKKCHIFGVFPLIIDVCKFDGTPLATGNGVRELFEQEPPPPPRKSRAELMKDIDADYYGYMDDDDGILIPLEVKAEKTAVQNTVAEWVSKKEQNLENAENQTEEESIYAVQESDDEESKETVQQLVDGSQQRFVAHVPVPSQQDIEQALLRRRKLELMEKYGVEEEPKS
ncbi:pre-mRNA-splicing factor ISY1 homolog [Diabrotica virgifera virgifera]|uniref:Uncharacterized protein n=1 Tax=Diabrotica virgifera virgifera TaxID=50390 RepID=A0ABM5KD49_DIAVI|nr:pre-mRNA-splicing factor ISY1 homolog [Diabrotica virgifera virgifera]